MMISMDDKDIALWIIDTDRRAIALKAFAESRVLHAADIAKKNGRSIQNISRALHELEKKDIITSIDEKTTWKKYLLTAKGEKILEKVNEILPK